ncbi:hypothetical protein AJ78_08450 [Emergomyces pasteurianus Ep9510]|uniref:Uncharacterized protein n=1 Tax=Emergomyces pasteurianus Ep9510 TaxID=1447872 RepID=A0A1J9Q3S9_9EURO|nr:hypothetical protein AJ78_08450 [Emergomyces pasteurianus Ep9510]
MAWEVGRVTRCSDAMHAREIIITPIDKFFVHRATPIQTLRVCCPPSGQRGKKKKSFPRKILVPAALDLSICRNIELDL